MRASRAMVPDGAARDPAMERLPAEKRREPPGAVWRAMLEGTEMEPPSLRISRDPKPLEEVREGDRNVVFPELEAGRREKTTSGEVS